ncbi:MAG: hypothetical protein KF752_01545 [Pirellulaceae bacterium]|nr:hypothetical protein [Pirellulaceae bacterium]
MKRKHQPKSSAKIPTTRRNTALQIERLECRRVLAGLTMAICVEQLAVEATDVGDWAQLGQFIQQFASSRRQSSVTVEFLMGDALEQYRITTVDMLGTGQLPSAFESQSDSPPDSQPCPVPMDSPKDAELDVILSQIAATWPAKLPGFPRNT